MPLNPKMISCSGVSQVDMPTALTALDVAVAAAVVTAKAVTGVIANQITIVPLSPVFDGTNYIGVASVLYSTS